jgi:hypothetical protein
MSRRYAITLLVLAAPFLVGVVTFALRKRTAITLENTAKIRIGMTRQEVERILGGPARDEIDGATRTIAVDKDVPPGPREFPATTCRWEGRDRKIEVAFNDEGRVISFWSGYPAGANRPLFEKALRYIGLWGEYRPAAFQN